MFHDPGRYRHPDDAAHGPERRDGAYGPDGRLFDDRGDPDWDFRYGRPGEGPPPEPRSYAPYWADRGPGPVRERDPAFDEVRDEDDHAGRWDFGRADRRYSLEDTRRRLPREETERLIASDKVEGTPVFDLHGRRLGHVENFMVDKRTGRVEYAVVRVRGGLVHGEAWRPVEWRDLTYDPGLDGYRLDLDRRDLRRDRRFERDR